MVPVFGSNGSGDALGTWIALMLAAGVACTVGGGLAMSGRWRGWYRAVDSPIRYAPLAGIPFGVGCLLETAATVLPLGNATRQAVAICLLVCLLVSGLLFLHFPSRLRPGWIRELDEAALRPTGPTGEGDRAVR